MKKSQNKHFMRITLLSIFLSITISGCLFDDRIEVETNSEMREYLIDPVTILGSLAQGNMGVFTLLEATPEVNPSSVISNYFWSQENYLQIAQALFKISWGETMEDLHLKSMIFGLKCSDVNMGAFSYASFEFEKIITIGKDESRVKYLLSIDPSKNSVFTSKSIFSPNIHFTLQPIDLTQFSISAEKALQISEMNGGYEKRLKVDNACKISLTANGTDGKSWYINYGRDTDINQSLFVIEIDPRSGEFKILESRP